MSFQLELNIPEIIARMYNLENHQEYDRFKAAVENFILSNAIDQALEKNDEEIALKVNRKGLLLDQILQEPIM